MISSYALLINKQTYFPSSFSCKTQQMQNWLVYGEGEGEHVSLIGVYWFNGCES